MQIDFHLFCGMVLKNKSSDEIQARAVESGKMHFDWLGTRREPAGHDDGEDNEYYDQDPTAFHGVTLSLQMLPPSGGLIGAGNHRNGGWFQMSERRL